MKFNTYTIHLTSRRYTSATLSSNNLVLACRPLLQWLSLINLHTSGLPLSLHWLISNHNTCPLQIAVLCNRTDVAHQLIRRENQHMKKYKGNCHLFQILTDLRQFEMLVACDIMCLFKSPIFRVVVVLLNL
jgi:hypothetical protein